MTKSKARLPFRYCMIFFVLTGITFRGLLARANLGNFLRFDSGFHEINIDIFPLKIINIIGQREPPYKFIHASMYICINKFMSGWPF